ncbi:MAG TPA: HigA family addiction module antitoxin [Hymenobacter sp.]|jgi:HTH-type transcriptional regulator/antitoxin HigA
MATSRSIALDTLIPAIAIRPGEILADEIAYLNISQREFAHQADIHFTILNEIIKGKRRITAEIALKLEAALDLTAEHWNNLQATYDLDQARIQQREEERLPAVTAMHDMRAHVPIAELRKRGVLVDDVVADVNRIFRLYGVATRQEVIQLVEKRKEAVALFRRSEKLQTNPINLTAWVMLAHEAARAQTVAAFDASMDQVTLLADLHQVLVRNENVVEQLTKRLAAAGIKLVIVKHLPQTPIDGMAWWCEAGECPAIALTIRLNRLDNLIFTLFHELGHVFLHLGKDKGPCEFLDLLEGQDEQEPAVEKEADNWATKNLVPEEVLEHFLNSKQRMQEAYLLEVAKHAKVNPVILLGQRCHVLREFASLKKAKYNQIG